LILALIACSHDTALSSRACSDLDCDGLTDLVTAGADAVHTWSPSDAAYEESAAFETDEVRDLATGDLDGDGYQDLVVCGASDTLILWGDTSGPGTEISDLGAHSCEAVLVDDFDADGVDDLVVLRASEDGQSPIDSLVVGASDRIITLEPLPTTGAIAGASGDFDGNGTTDLAVCNRHDPTARSWSTATSHVYAGTGQAMAMGLDTDPTRLETAGCTDVVAHDLDRDGYSELLFPALSGAEGPPTIPLYWGSAKGFADEPTALPASASLTAAIGDVDGDGWDDIVLPAFHGHESLVVWNGPAGLEGTDVLFEGVGFADALVVDLDGDGDQEVVLGRRYDEGASPGHSVVLYQNGQVDTLPTGSVTWLGAADVDADGLDELLVSNLASGPQVFRADGTVVELPGAGSWGPVLAVGAE